MGRGGGEWREWEGVDVGREWILLVCCDELVVLENDELGRVEFGCWIELIGFVGIGIVCCGDFIFCGNICKKNSSGNCGCRGKCDWWEDWWDGNGNWYWVDWEWFECEYSVEL